MQWKVYLRYTTQSPKQNLLVATVHPSHKKSTWVCCRVCPLCVAAETAKVSTPSQGGFLTEFCNEDIECTDLCTYSVQWVKQVNRGGLGEVNDMVYLLCREIELEVRNCFVKDSIHELMAGSKQNVVSAILFNESVQFIYC